MNWTQSRPRHRLAQQILQTDRTRIHRNGPDRLISRTAVYGPVCTVVWEGSLVQIAKELSRYLIGWRGYFGFCETPSVLSRLDQWIRRRLRSLVWKQWKRGKTRFAELRRRGVERKLAAQTAGSAYGPWRLSHSPALAIALPNKFFRRIELASIATAQIA